MRLWSVRAALETYTSATGVARTAREYLTIRSDESKLRELDIDTITSKDVFDAASAGDRLALEIFESTGAILGEACADFVTFSLSRSDHLLRWSHQGWSTS